MYSAMQIAKYTINKCTTEGHPISNLQLQKILYYIQRELLQSGIDGFEDEIQAWQFGPVVPEVYCQYCGFGAIPIRMKYDVEIGPEYTNIIDPIIEQKRILNPWDMVTDTHQAGKSVDV